MRHLIEELMQPRQMPDGTIRHPTTLMRKAGEHMMQINELWNQDRAGRSKAEILCNDLLEQVHKLEDKIIRYEVTHGLEDAVKEYLDVMNKDYDQNFT